MAIITEDFVSFEIAKLLKEKGFDEGCPTTYTSNGFFHTHNYRPLFGDIFAPTLQMVMKWLREIHNIHIAVGIGADVDNSNYIFYAPSIATFIPHKSITYLDGVFEEEEYNTAEQACEAAIKYCLENLI